MGTLVRDGLNLLWYCKLMVLFKHIEIVRMRELSLTHLLLPVGNKESV